MEHSGINFQTLKWNDRVVLFAHTIDGKKNDEFEIVVGQAQGLRDGTREQTQLIFLWMNGNW
jgi:hypothetical protein